MSGFEIFGVIGGAMSLLCIFESCIDAFHRVRVAQDLDDDRVDVEMSLDLLRLRLTRWGQLLGFGQQGDLGKCPTPIAASDEEMRLMDRFLNRLYAKLQDAEQYASRRVQVAEIEDDSSALSAATESHRALSQMLTRHHAPDQSGVREKICWDLYQKDDCKELLSGAVHDMTALEAVHESAHKVIVDRALQTLARRQAELLTENNLLQVLAPVAKMVDTKLLLAISSVGKANGTEIHIDRTHGRGSDKVWVVCCLRTVDVTRVILMSPWGNVSARMMRKESLV